MKSLKSIGIAVAIICSLCLFGQVLTPCASAQLAIDDHYAEHVNAMVSVSIDSLSYDGAANGVVEVFSTYAIHNLDEDSPLSYKGELRLEVTDLDGTAFMPHAEEAIFGSIKKYDDAAHWRRAYDSSSRHTNLHLECLSPTGWNQPGIEAYESYTMDAKITLTFNAKETWTAPYSTDFLHWPQADVEQQVGIGPTKDGETFSDDCTVNWEDVDEPEKDEWTTWKSLLYTDGLYYAVYWYVKAPGDTSAYGTSAGVVWGDGVTRKATMTTSFPEDVDIPSTPGDEDAVWYEITAYVYKWDLSVYSTSYLVFVHDK